MSNIYYVYTHSDPNTLKVKYVGKGSKNRAYVLYKRYAKHSNWIKSLKNKNQLPVINIIYNNLQEQDAFNLEKELILFIKDQGGELLNMTDGGEGPSGVKFSKEEIERRRAYAASRKGHLHPRKGKKTPEKSKALHLKAINEFWKNASPEYRKKVGAKHLGKPKSEESKLKMSIAAKKRWGTYEY
jgi:hypothetical protein